MFIRNEMLISPKLVVACVCLHTQTPANVESWFRFVIVPVALNAAFSVGIVRVDKNGSCC